MVEVGWVSRGGEGGGGGLVGVVKEEGLEEG